AKDTQLGDTLDYEFVFMKFADIDGSLLNQGWFDGPFTLSNYAQNFYRPASYEQVEWTFPMDYKDYTFDESLPETEILMEIIETHQPDFIYSLHNAGFGGCYYYISEECSEIFDDLRQISRDQDVPLDLGEPEAPWMEEFDDAIYQMPSSEMNYDYLEENTDDSPAEVLTTGAGSYDYAREHNAEVVELVTELPYFYDEQIESDTKTDRTRREIVLEGIEKEAALVNFLEDQYDRIADDLPDTRFKRAIADIIDNFHDRIEAKRNWAKTDDELDEN
ncbi:MAG: peptidase M14, partial [Halobacteriaceae archaeon]